MKRIIYTKVLTFIAHSEYMAYIDQQTPNFADMLVNQKLSYCWNNYASYRYWSRPSTKNDLVMYTSIAIGVAIIISSFSIIIKQYERAIPKTS